MQFWRKILKISFVFVLVYSILYLLDTSCLVKYLIGIPCPGCGMTRATICALRLDFVKAFQYNRMFWIVPILILYLLKDFKVFSKSVDRCVLLAMILGLIANWIFNLFYN